MNAIVWLFNAICEWFKSIGKVSEAQGADEVLETQIELTCLNAYDRRNLWQLCNRKMVYVRKNDKGNLYLTIEQVFWLKNLMDKGYIKGEKQKEIINMLIKVADRRV